MTDRVYPSAKPAGNPAFPATKAQLYSNARPAYRPQPRHRRRSRCCSCCLWLTVAFLILLLLVGLAGVVFYVVYRPQRPSFAVSSLKLSYLNLTSSSQLNSRFDVSVTARNPNKKLVYSYDPIAISIFSGAVDVGDGVVPAFVHGKRNTISLKAQISSSRKSLDETAASDLKSSMKSRNGLPLKVKLDTKVKAKVGGLKSPKIGVRVVCDGIRVTLPAKKAATATAATSKAKCKVDVRVKIWKWTF